MIADLKTFIERERPHWQELERELGRIRDRFADMSDLKYSRHILSLFQRASSDLARIQGWSAEPELKAYLETLVGTGYAEIHSATRNTRHFRPWHWLTRSFPQAFRRQVWGWHVSVWLTIGGCVLGALLIVMDVEGAREAIFPFPHLAKMSPAQRVAWEESRQAKDQEKGRDSMEGRKSYFSARLMQNNIGVSIKALAFGITWGLGTVLLLFYNGVILGGVALDYIADGQTTFLIAWLLPHGSVEIPAILIAGQGGLVMGRALIGWGTPDGLRTRFRKVAPDLAHLAGGVAVLLVWAGIIEAFFSQYHAPILPYSLKIAFGAAEVLGLSWFLFFCGREAKEISSMKERSTATLDIATPEGVIFSLPLAGPVTRSVACFIDYMAMSVAWNIIRMLIMPFFIVSLDFGIGLMVLLQFVFIETARMLMELLWHGQTLGKRVLGLRVMDERALKLRPSQVILRNLMRWVDFLPGFYALGGMVSFFSARGQRLGDLAAGTVVVRSIKVTPPDVAGVLAGKFNSFRDHPHLETRLRQKVKPEEAQLALHALVRRDELETEARVRIYEQLATLFREKVMFPEDAVFGLSDEQYVRNVVETIFRSRKSAMGA